MAHPPRLSGFVAPALIAGLLLQSCGEGRPAAARNPADGGIAPGVARSEVATPDVLLRVDVASGGPPVNRLVLGSNVQWVDGGDNLLRAGTGDWDPTMQRLVLNMAPGALRYPGGEQSDLYDWRRGMGPLPARGTNLQAGTLRPQVTYMGSAELLELAQATNAAVLLTVNVLTGTPAQAAAWVTQMNISPAPNPAAKPDTAKAPPGKVVYWEIGNEPYLPSPGSHGNSCAIDPVTYAARVNSFASAMRAADPSIKIGIALANDFQNEIPVVSPHCRHFTATVLDALREPVDFISLHDAYLPYDPSGRDHSAAEEYQAAMASSAAIEKDFAAMRAQLQKYPRISGLPFAITEYNALFSLNPKSAFIHSMASPMGALYVADALRLFAGDDQVLMANLWSLSGNDHWGAIHPAAAAAGPYGRPTYEVFRVFSEALQGVRLKVNVQSPRFDAPGLGFSVRASGLPLVTALATAVAGNPAGTLRVVAINKDYGRAHVASLSIGNVSVRALHVSLLTAENVLQDDDLPGAMQRSESDAAVTAPLTVNLPAHSIALLTLLYGPPP